MSLHRLPDGRVIEIKDNLGDQELIALQNHLAELYPGYYTPYIEEVERTFGGEVFNAVKQIPGGFINSFLTAGEGVVNYFDQGNDSAVGNLLRDAQEAVSDTYSPLKGYEDAYSTGLGQGLGSFASYFVPGTLASKAAQRTKGFQALSPAEKFARQSAAGIAGVSGLAVPSGIAIAGRTMEQAKALGEEVSPFQEFLAETLGGAIGFTETITPARFLRYVPKSAGKLLPSDRLMFALQSGGIEGAQEAFAGVAQNAVARGIYSDKVPIFESTLDDFTIGGGVGFIADLVTRGLMDKRGIGREYLLDKEREQRKVTEQQRFNKRKDFKKAIDEGAVVLPLESEVDVINTEDAQVDVPVVESTLEFAEIPLLEEFEIIQNPNGTASIIGINTSKDYGVFSNIEEAAKQAVVLRKKLRNDYVDAAVKQNLSVNGLYGNGTAYTLGRKVYDPISNLIPVQVLASLDSRINIARKTKAQKEKEIKQKLDRSIINDLLGDQQLNEEQLIQLEEQLLKQQTSFPIKATKIDASSLVGQLHTRARKKGIAPKSYYTPQEAKKILLPADFNSLMSEKAHVIEKTQRKTGDRVAIARSREKIGVTRSDFKKVFKSKNIISDLNSPAFEYIAEQITGTKSFNNMNRGQKELLINELKRLPRFDIETKLPDFRPRAYSVNDLNRLYTEYKGQRITNNEIKAFVKNKQTGKNLTPKELKALREDLVNSGRADKVNNRLEMSDDFEKRQAKRAQSLNESTEEFAQRLRETTALSEQEINNVLEKDIKDVVETDELLALPAPESVGKYKKLFEFARKRLNQLGLKDIALKFDNALKMSTEIRFVDGKPVFNPVPFENKASFDIPMRTILAAMNRIDPDGTLTEAEFQSKLAGLMDHEAIHALRELDLLTEDEYQTLVQYAIEKLPEDLKRGITRAYPDNLVIRDEEYVAELFRLYRENPKQIIGKPKGIIKRIIDFFFGAVDSIFGAGFRSPESILQDLDTGVIGSRARNKVRSLRETQLKQAAGLTNPESRFSKEIDTVRKLLATAESELYTAESILNVDGAYVGKKRYQKLFSDMLRAQNKVDNLKEELRDLTGDIKSRFSKSGLTAQNTLYPGETEQSLLTLYRSNKGDLTANNLQALHKSVSPQSKRKHKWRDIKEIRNDLRDAITKNMDYLWYERWGVGIPNIVGDVNMNEFSAIFGITSAQSKPEQNLKDTLRAMIVARKIDPVEQPKKYIAELKKFGVAMNNNARLNDIAKVYKTGLYNRQGTGQKTATYALEILDAANNRFTPFSVIDRHMLRKFGIELQEGQKTTEQEYRITQGLIALLAAENITVNGEPRNFTPRQVQALLWAHQRYSGPTNVTNEGSYNSAVSAAQQEISDLNNLESEGLFSKDRTFSGVFIHQPRFNSKAKSNLFDTDLKNNMYQMIVNEAPTVLFEFKMGKTRGYLPENIDQSINFDQFFDYQENMLNAITSGNKIRFLRELGIPHEITRSAGTYDGYLNPNILLKLPGAEPRTVRALAQIFTDAFMQDSAITLRPTKQGVFQTGLIIEKPDQSLFTVAELQDLNRSLSQMTRGGEQVNFTLQATDKTGIVLIDPISFNKDRPYTKQDANNFAESIRPILGGKGYNLKRYGQESEYIEYGAESSYSPGTRSAIRGLRDRESLLESSDLQRAALRDLYIPAYEAYKKFAKEIGLTQEQAPNLNLKPYEQENSALAGETVLADIDIAEVQREARRRAERYSRGNIPRFNTNASPVALAIAFEYEANPKKFDVPPDISSRFYRDYAKIPKGYEEVLDDIGGAEQPSESFGQSILKSLGWRGSIGKWLSDARTQFIDKLNDVEKGIIQSAERSAEVRELENLADTSAIAALRHADRARGIFAAMLKNGVPTLEKGLTSVKDFEHGGLLKIFAPLFADPEVNLEQLFKIYAIAQRSERLAMEGKKVPVTEETKIKAKQIEQDFPIVKEVWNKYQAYNNEVIKFAVDSGILSYDRSKNELIKDIVEITDNKAKDLVNLELNDLLKIAAAEGIETRGTAQIWLDNSDYYPFYRQMQDETIKGPNIAAGYISGNPLNIKLKGSEEDINISPLEAIARNNLAIVTAAMKNEGLARLARNFELAGMAVRVPAKDAKGADIMPVFIDGERVFFKVADPLLINGLQAMGINDQGILGQVLGAPAGFLRETITRDPGFMFVNLLRDSLSTAVTSGADITPIVDTFDKFFNSNLTELERFGIIGGYDFSNDPQNIKQYIKKEYRKMGIGNNGALTATDAVIKLWDWLGEYTTKSDGATRSAVYDKIFELTGSQAEAAYQALEIINFGRRGASPIFRLVTTAVTFLNARLQGLDVLGRAHLGRYSAVSKFGKDQTLEDMRNGIALGTFQRGMYLAFLTGLYYLMFSDEEEYKNARREVRDDNWIIPLFEGMPALKIPIPFEVGVLYKVVPERAFDLALGDADLDETMKTLGRQLGVTLKVDLTPQVVKPLLEVINNRNNYTGQDIVPYYMEQGMEPGYQSRYSTNEFVRLLGETLNISPLKLEYFLRGYTGTIGTYVLSTVDTVTRQFTDRDVIMPRIDSAPLLRRFFQTELGGGYQQQFYELRAESDKFIQTLNSLKREGRLEEAQAFLLNNQGLARTRPQILALERYMNNYRKQRDRVLNSDLSPENKKTILEQLDYERDIRLMYLNTLKEQI